VPGGIKTELKAKRLLPVPISLPPLSEQQRIVAKIEQLAAKIEEARELRNQVVAGCEQLCRSIILFQEYEKTVPTRMDELVKWRKPDVEVLPTDTYHFAGVYCFGRGVFAGERKTGLEFSYRQLTQIRAGEFIYPKLMAWEGALAVVPLECDGLYVSPEFPVFEINTDRVLPETLDVYFRTPAVWPQLSGSSTGTNVRRRRLNPNEFLRFEFPLPSMRTQQLLRLVKAKVDRLKALQAQTAAELEALLPSILDKAFKGEL
jgi:type I restriction enzyme S subunit